MVRSFLTILGAIIASTAALDGWAHPLAGQEHFEVFNLGSRPCIGYHGPTRRLWESMSEPPSLFDEQCTETVLDAAGVGHCVRWEWFQCFRPEEKATIYLGPVAPGWEKVEVNGEHFIGEIRVEDPLEEGQENNQ